MSLTRYLRSEELRELNGCKKTRSHSAQGLTDTLTSPAMKLPPLPPCLWITEKDNESSDLSDCEDEVVAAERQRVRSRFRHYKQRSLHVPLGIFWDIENCQVPHGCSAIDVVAAIRTKFLVGRREADFVVVCDVRKESPIRLQELNDAQVSLIHVCGTQKNAADEKLRQCMRRFGELHVAPASLLLISGDINFAADLSDFRHRKNMEVILVHKQNTSAALIACASSHYCYNELTANLPRNSKIKGQVEEEPSCEMEVSNLPMDQPPERVSRRLRRLADNCGGKVLRVNCTTAMMKFPTTDHASRALKRMNGEDVFGRKISIRYVRTGPGQAAYSSDEGYSTGQPQPARSLHSTPLANMAPPPLPMAPMAPGAPAALDTPMAQHNAEWSLALQQLPAPTPPPLDFCPPPAPKPRKITGAHGSVNLDGSACSSNSCDRDSIPRAFSPWNSSTFSEQSEGDCDAPVELTVTNLPMFEVGQLQKMLIELFTQYVAVNKVNVWQSSEGPIATIHLRSEWDARVAIAKVHKRRLDYAWSGRRLELTLGRPSPAQNLDVLRARIRAIFMDQKNVTLPLLQLRDAYASRHCCALTTSDLAKVKDTVIVHETCGRMVQLIDLSPVTEADMDEAPWKCHIHAGLSSGHEDGSRILQPVNIELAVLANNVKVLLENHRGLLPLLTFVECYEATFPPFVVDVQRGVCLELLLRSVAGIEIKDSPSRHLVFFEPQRSETPHSGSFRSGSSRSGGSRRRTAPTLEPMLMLLERELTDLLRSTPKCSISFNKLIPSFHRHFGRQCRVADYGFTKLPDLLAALNNTIVVLGSGSSRIVTISPQAQSRRWTSDLIKLLDAQPGRCLSPHDIPQQYETIFGTPFTPVSYGVCTISELMNKITPQSVVISPNGMISLPRRTPTPIEQERTAKFAEDVIELLSYTPNLRMEFSRFVPAYHAHFGRQLRVAHYGCVKLYELFELIQETVFVAFETSGEKSVQLTPKAALTPVAQRIKTLVPLPLRALTWQYAAHYKAVPQLDILNVSTLEAFVLAAGFKVENGMIYSQGDSAIKTTSALTACAVLSADRSVARGSSEDYFITSFRELEGFEPDVGYLAKCGVVRVSDRQVILTSIWRTVWRVAQLLVDRGTSLSAMEIYSDYTKTYEPFFLYASLGIDGVAEFLRQHRAVFAEESLGRWSLVPGVVLRRIRRPRDDVDTTIYDTPPGQKGSRVFDSPKIYLWNSPPASALPLPSALLSQDNKRRVRLAPLFDAN